MSTLAELMSAAMAEAGLSQAKTAEAIGVSTISLSNLLSKGSLPNKRTLAKYAAFLKQTPEQLTDLIIGARGTMAQKPQGKAAGKATKQGKTVKKAAKPAKAKAKAAGAGRGKVRKAKTSSVAQAYAVITGALDEALTVINDDVAIAVHLGGRATRTQVAELVGL